METSNTTTRHDGRGIRYFRKLRRISITTLAERLNNNVKEVKKIESTRELSDDVLAPIAEALETTINDIRAAGEFEDEKSMYCENINIHDYGTNHINFQGTITNNYTRDEEDKRVLRSILHLALTGELTIPNAVREEFAKYEKLRPAEKNIDEG